MDQTTATGLRRFASAANKDILHPLDWQRFYDVVIDAHRRGLMITDHDVRTRLEAEHFPEDVAIRLASIFAHGLDLLKRYEGTKV